MSSAGYGTPPSDWTSQKEHENDTLISMAYRITETGNIYHNSVHDTRGVRPVITLIRDITVTSGNGGSTSKY